MTDLILCRKCGIEKPVNAFYVSTLRKNKTAGECKDCVCARVTASKQKPHRRSWFTSDGFKKKNSGYFHDYVEKYPGRRRVRLETLRAIKKGLLVRAEKCEQCSCTQGIEAHHDDYNHPLDVRWLCKDCHGFWHRYNDPVYIRED